MTSFSAMPRFWSLLQTLFESQLTKMVETQGAWICCAFNGNFFFTFFHLDIDRVQARNLLESTFSHQIFGSRVQWVVCLLLHLFSFFLYSFIFIYDIYLLFSFFSIFLNYFLFISFSFFSFYRFMGELSWTKD